MNLGKMVNIFDNNHDGIIVNLGKQFDNLLIDVKIRYLAKKFDQTYELLKYKIINYKRLELSVDEKHSYFDIDEIKKMQLTIINAEVGFNHSLLINVWNKTITKGKLHIWSNYNNDIKIYDQSDNEMEYETFNAICRVNKIIG